MPSAGPRRHRGGRRRSPVPPLRRPSARARRSGGGASPGMLLATSASPHGGVPDMGRVDPGDRSRDQGAPRQGPRSGGEAMALDAAVRPDPAPHPGASVLDRLTRSCVLRLSRLEQVKDVLRARGRPKSEELVIRIGEGPTAADRHSARVSDLRENHGWKLVSPAFAQDPWGGARPPVSLRLAEASVIPTKDETLGARPSRERG
jgi:hypothetical protein